MIYSLDFYYDGLYSEDMGVRLVNIDSGLQSDSFLAPTNVDYVKLRNNYKSIIKEVVKEPLVFPMALFFEENLDRDQIELIKNWLNKDDFKPLIFEQDLNRVYFATIDGESNLTHNSISSGYLEFNFLTNSPYSFSPPVEIEGVSTELESEIIVYNSSSIDTLPTITIKMNSNTDIQITNKDTGELLSIKSNFQDEVIEISCEYEEVESDIENRYRYDDHNDVFIRFKEGRNRLAFEGDFDYTIDYRLVYD